MLKIVLPYRDRQKHLDISLSNFPIFFDQHYKDNYQIHIVEQCNNKKFNLAKIINIGYKTFSFEEGDSFLYHPIDHWPSNSSANKFDCPKDSFKILLNNGKDLEDDFQYIYAFLKMKKTIPRIRAFSICPQLFNNIGGYPTMFDGWGAEDNAFFIKIIKQCDNDHIIFEKINWLTDENHDRDKSNKFINQLILIDFSYHQDKYKKHNLANTNYKIISKKDISKHIIHYKIDWND